MTATPKLLKQRAIDFKGHLADFEHGQLCFVVARRLEGTGAVKLLMHKAVPYGPNGKPEGCGFGYGTMGCYVVSPGTLMGLGNGERKRAASQINGAKNAGVKRPNRR